MRSWYWWEDAACRTADADLFYTPEGVPKEQRRAAERQAKLICLRCPVREECLATALEHDESYGIWGGLSARERKRRFAKTA